MFTTAVHFGERAAVWHPDPAAERPGTPGVFLPGPGGSAREQCRTARRCNEVRPPNGRPVRASAPGPNVAASGPNVAPSGPDVAPSSGPDVAPSGPDVAPSPGPDPELQVEEARRARASAEPVATAVLELNAWRSAVMSQRPGPEVARLLAARPDALAPRDRSTSDRDRHPGAPGSGSTTPTGHPVSGVGEPAHPAPSATRDLTGLVVTSWANGLVDGMDARQRLIAHLTAEQYRDAVALQRRYPGLIESLPGELSLALGVTERTASDLLQDAHRLDTVLTRTLQALHDGKISIDTTHALLNATAACTPEVARAAEATVLDALANGASSTYHAVRSRAARAVIAADPDGAEQRHRRAARRRRITRWTEEDGMAAMHIRSTAQDIATIWECVTALADGAKTPEDTRDLGNRRVDALVDLCAGILSDGGTQGLFGPTAGVDLPKRHGVRPHIQVTMPFDALLGGTSPCELSGHGAITAEQARQIAADGELRRLVCDPLSGTLLDYGHQVYRPPKALTDFVAARDQTCPFPGCRQPAGRGDFDHIVPARPDPVTGKPTHGRTSADNGALPCPHHHIGKDAGRGFILVRSLDGSFHWTTPLGRTAVRPPTRLWEPRPGDDPRSGAASPRGAGLVDGDRAAGPDGAENSGDDAPDTEPTGDEAPGDTTSDTQTSATEPAGDEAPGDTTSDTQTSGNEPAGDGASGDTTSGNETCGDIAAGDEASGNTASGTEAPGNTASGTEAPGSVMPAADVSGNDAGLVADVREFDGGAALTTVPGCRAGLRPERSSYDEDDGCALRIPGVRVDIQHGCRLRRPVEFPHFRHPQPHPNPADDPPPF